MRSSSAAHHLRDGFGSFAIRGRTPCDAKSRVEVDAGKSQGTIFRSKRCFAKNADLGLRMRTRRAEPAILPVLIGEVAERLKATVC